MSQSENDPTYFPYDSKERFIQIDLWELILTIVFDA